MLAGTDHQMPTKSKVDMPHSVLTSFLLGLIIVFNFIVLPNQAASPRLIDIILIAAPFIYLFYIPISVEYMGKKILVGIFIIFIFLLHIIFNTTASVSDYVLCGRWILSVPLCLLLIINLRTSHTITYFCYGLIVGCLLNVLVLVGQFVGLGELLRKIGLVSIALDRDSYGGVLDLQRYTGMWEHPNATMAVISLIIPASLWLYKTKKHNLKIVLSAWAVLLFAFIFTQTRSPVMCAALITFVVLIIDKTFNKMWLILIMALFISGILILGPPGGWERWAGYDTLDKNFTERFASTIASLSVTFQSPFGNTLLELQGKIAEHTNYIVTATHNGLFFIGGYFGFIALFLIAGCLLIPFFQKGGVKHEDVVFHQIFSGFILLLFMFEEHPRSPVFAILTMLCILYKPKSEKKECIKSYKFIGQS